MKIHSGRFYVNTDVDLLLNPQTAQQTLWNAVRRFDEVFASELYKRPGLREANCLFVYVGRVTTQHHPFDPDSVWIFHDQTWAEYGAIVGRDYPVSFPTV